MRWILVAMLLVAANATPATARLSGYDCQVYFGEDDHPPPEVREMLNLIEGSLIRKCSSSRGYGLTWPPSQHPLGVCLALEKTFVNEAGTLVLVRTEGSEPGFPRLLMMIADGDCPRQDDPRYLVTENVTVGTFKAAVRLWEKASADEKSFSALLAELNKNDHVVRFCGGLEKFESDFRRGNLELTAVRFEGDAVRLDLGRLRGGFFWSLLVDFKNEELAVLELGCTIA